MSCDSRSIGSRIYETAKNLDIHMTVVQRVVSRYFELCKFDLCNGRIVRIFGFVTLTPNVVTSEFVDTTAMYCKRVAELESVTYFTVKAIMRDFLSGCKDDLFNGKTVTFRALATLHPTQTDGEVSNIHVAVSAMIKEKLTHANSDVTSVRASMCKVLKGELQRFRVSDRRA